VRVDSQNVYYRDDDGVVFAAAKDGRETTWSSATPDAPSDRLRRERVQVFCCGRSRGARSSSGQRRRQRFTALDTAGDTTGVARVDATAVFYWHNSSLMKRLK